jgi:hypothetical protein
LEDQKAKKQKKELPGKEGKGRKKETERQKLIRQLGKKLILDDQFVTNRPVSDPNEKEYGVIIYYNGSVRPNV